MTPVALPSELWNFVVLVVLCALVGWGIRLLNLAFLAVDLRHALKSGSTIYLNDLGPSLPLLSCASLRHFEQLMRISYEPVTTPMLQIYVPFELLAGSLRLDEGKRNKPVKGPLTPSSPHSSSSAMQLSLLPLQDQLQVHDDANGQHELSFRFQARERCFVQVFWGVRAIALEQINLANAHESSTFSPLVQALRCGRTRSGRHRDVLKFIQNVGLFPKLIMQRFFSEETNLLSEHADDNSSSTDSNEGMERTNSGLSVLDLLEEDMIESKSIVYQYEAGESLELHTRAASIATQGSAMDPEVPLEEKVEASDHVNRELNATASELIRYGAVVAFFCAEMVDDEQKKNRTSTKCNDEKVLCHLVAIDFLPTPIKATPFAPVVIKRFDFTRTKCFIPYDIFGSDASNSGECVICLEKRRTATLLPCRHLCVCVECLEEIDRCPICRTKFNMYTCYNDDQDVSKEETPEVSQEQARVAQATEDPSEESPEQIQVI